MRTVLFTLAFSTLAASAAAQETGATAPPAEGAAPAAEAPAAEAAPAAEGAASADAQADVSTDNLPAADATEEDTTIPGSLVLGLGVGGIFPQPFTSLGTHVAVAFQLGYRLPFAGERLEIITGLAYSPPNNSFDTKQPVGTTFAGDTYSGEVTEKELHTSLGLKARLNDRTVPWNVNLGLGGRLFFLETVSSGKKGGQSFLEYKEQSSQFGFFAVIGGEYNLGPGALFLDVDFGYASLPHKITGDANTGNITGLIGYRLFLL